MASIVSPDDRIAELASIAKRIIQDCEDAGTPRARREKYLFIAALRLRAGTESDDEVIDLGTLFECGDPDAVLAIGRANVLMEEATQAECDARLRRVNECNGQESPDTSPSSEEDAAKCLEATLAYDCALANGEGPQVHIFSEYDDDALDDMGDQAETAGIDDDDFDLIEDLSSCFIDAEEVAVVRNDLRSLARDVLRRDEPGDLPVVDPDEQRLVRTMLRMFAGSAPKSDADDASERRRRRDPVAVRAFQHVMMLLGLAQVFRSAADLRALMREDTDGPMCPM